MSKVKSPREKKRLSLTKDHRTFAWKGNKTFRAAWRLKKAKINRELRRAATVALARAKETGDIPIDLKARPKRALYKHGVYSLGQAISVKRGVRKLRFKRRLRA